MEPESINLKVVASVAKALAELNEQMVFVGGAVVGLYAEGVINEELRPTSDIDLTIDVVSLSAWRNLDKRLSMLGINPDPDGHAICSYKYGSIPLDIMPISDTLRGPSNRWYSLGLGALQKEDLDGVMINILPAPCYLATKFEAYSDRGTDYRTSHDFEDIIFVMINREKIVAEIANTKQEILVFLQEEFSKIMISDYRNEILSAHLPRQNADELHDELLEKIEAIINST